MQLSRSLTLLRLLYSWMFMQMPMYTSSDALCSLNENIFLFVEASNLVLGTKHSFV